MRSAAALSKSGDQDSLEISWRELLTSLSPLPVLNFDDDVVIDDSSSSASWKLNIKEFVSLNIAHPLIILSSVSAASALQRDRGRFLLVKGCSIFTDL